MIVDVFRISEWWWCGSEPHDKKECFNGNSDDHDDEEEMNKSGDQLETHCLYESWRETTFFWELVSTFNMIIVIIMMI